MLINSELNTLKKIVVFSHLMSALYCARIYAAWNNSIVDGSTTQSFMGGWGGMGRSDPI